MAARVDADIAIKQVARVVDGLPAFIAGSSAAAAHHFPVVEATAYSDIDIFCASPEALVAAAERYRAQGYELSDRSARVYARALKFGFGDWHTNSIKLEGLGHDVNLVYKTMARKPVASLAQVLESFDFGFLAIGYDAMAGEWRDLRPFYYPGMSLAPEDPLPLLPERREAWRNGFISRYQGLRMITRYVKYLDYGYNMSLIADDMVTGYTAAGEYNKSREDHPELPTLGAIYLRAAEAITAGETDVLRGVDQELITLDNLDAIMEGLE